MTKQALFVFSLFYCISNIVLAEPVLVRIGSKKFTESYILSEIMAQFLESKNYRVQRKFGMEGGLVYQALLNNEIDLYAEYSGTISHNILKEPSVNELTEINVKLASFELQALTPLGFNNTYAIAVRREMAKEMGLSKVSDLKGTDLKGALSYEFSKREDGWPKLKKVYQFKLPIRAMEHSLAYEALRSKKADITDAYTTDAKLNKFDLIILEDDLNYFPKYLALPLLRKTLSRDLKNHLKALAGTISEATMIQLNAKAEYGGESFSQIAKDFLLQKELVKAQESGGPKSFLWMNGMRLWQQALRHLQLTFISILMAVIVAIPLGVLLYFNKRMASPVLILSGILQTIPAIALLAFMIPIFGIGVRPAIAALFLFSILPILRNTYTAFQSIDPNLLEAAKGIGLKPKEIMWLVQLPLASPIILAGIRTATIISVGTATLAAFIGAGGLGESIVTGLALNDNNLVLQGAIPAAMLAIILELVFEFVSRKLDSRLGVNH